MASESRDVPLKLCMVTQQLRGELWSKYSSEVIEMVEAAAAATGGDPEVLREHARKIGEVVLKRLDDDGETLPDGDDAWFVSSAHAVIHDKDTQELWDDVTQQLVTCPKATHIHIVVSFTEKVGSLGAIAKAVGFPVAHIEKSKPGRYAHDNMLSYLIHAKDVEKHQYSPEQVATLKGRDYRGIHAERSGTWHAGRAVKIKESATSPEAVEDLFEKCLTGEVRKGQIMLSDKYAAIYSRNRHKIDDALETFQERRMWKAAEALKRGEFKTQVYYIKGAPGSGKSWLAEKLIDSLIENAPADERWEAYKAAALNPLDGYKGEEIIWMDDLRPASMDASNWLQLLDPNRPSPASARYKNKENVAPRVIIISVYMDPVDFFFFVKSRGGQNEAMNQFIRRLWAIIHVVDIDKASDDARYSIDLIGKRKVYERDVDMANGTSKSVILKYGMAARGRTSDESELIDFFTQVVMQSTGSSALQLDGVSAPFEILDADVIEENEAEAARVAAAELFERNERSQREWNERHGILNMPFATN